MPRLNVLETENWGGKKDRKTVVLSAEVSRIGNYFLQSVSKELFFFRSYRLPYAAIKNNSLSDTYQGF